MKNLDFDWNDLKFFLAAARQGGLTKAAAALRTSPSTVSRHIAALEERLQATLFLRQQTGYLLTDDGTELLRQVENVEQAMIAAERGGPESMRLALTGRVRLATTEMLALHLIVPNLVRFREQHPKLQVELGISIARANLSRREADLALRIADPNADEGAGDYIVSRAGKMDFAPYCAAGLISARKAGDVKSWQKLDYISWDDSWADLPMAKWLQAAFPDKAAALACNSMQAHYAAIRTGLGIGMLPCFVADKDASLQRLAPKEEPVSRDLWLVYHRDLKASQRVIALREFVQALVRSLL